MAREQDYSSHRRFHPWHHFVVQPILIANMVVQIQRYMQLRDMYQFWQMLLGIGLVLFAFTARGMALKAQDRVIRLEERMRLRELMPGQTSAINSLRTGQLIALRFAPDDEVPGLFNRIVSGELVKPDQIKREIKVWRPDYLRV
jgi:putative copper export protein